MHQTMALTISNIARIHPNKFDMLKRILTEYSDLIEQILIYRKTGHPAKMFLKLQEFISRSIEGYLAKYEDNEITDEEKPVITVLLDGIATIEEQIEIFEGVFKVVEPELAEEKKSVKPTEDWGKKPVIKKQGGMPDLDTPIENVKGIGEKTAEQLKEIGVKTLEDFVEYKKAQKNKLDESINDE
jgi:predicted flap endonuclease-1-like 5' DNA nuclease